MSVIDADARIRLVKLGGDRLLAEMIGLFLELGPARLEAALAGERDWEAAERGSHSLRSAAGNLGATQLQEMAGLAEDAAHRRDAAALRSAADALSSAYAAAAIELRTMLQGLEP